MILSALVFYCFCTYLWMSKACADSAWPFKFFIRASMAMLMKGTIYTQKD